MYCSHCGERIDVDSKFCSYCGKNVTDSPSNTSDSDRAETKNKSLSTNIWDKFVEIYDAKDDERDKYNSYISDTAWELLERLSVNAFETYLTQNKEELNRQPYKVIEILKNVFYISGSGGYKLWLAENFLREIPSKKFKTFDIDDIVDEWKKYDFESANKKLSEELIFSITKYTDFRLNNFIENAPSAKELSNGTIQNLKEALLLLVINGYHSGNIENTYRK